MTTMNGVRTRFATLTSCSLVCAAWLLGATCAAAAPITIGTFEVLNADDPFAPGPTFVVTNDSVDTVFPGFSATFANVHLVFDLLNLSTVDFLLTGGLAPGAIDSNGLTDDLGNSLLPDLATVLDAYLTLTLLNPVTGGALDGVVALGPTNPPLCAGCLTRMVDFTDMSTLAIQFDPESRPVPEPASLLLVGSGIAAWAAGRRRSRR